MPRNGTDPTSGEVGGEGKPIDPTEWNRNDGFSPGTMVLTFVPGLDLPRTWGTQDRPLSAAGINEPGYFDHRDQLTDIPLSLSPDAPIADHQHPHRRPPPVLERARQPQPDPGRPARALILRPAVNFEEGTRYVVAMRRLKDAAGATHRPDRRLHRPCATAPRPTPG